MGRFAAVGGLLSLLAGGCLPAPAAPGPTAAVLVLDLSASARRSDRCTEAASRLDTLMRARRPLDVLILGTGQGQGDEPVVLVPWRRFSPFGSFLATRKGPSPAEIWRKQTVAECRRSLLVGRQSPVFLAVRRGAESLDAHCAALARSGHACGERYLFVHSDLHTDPSDPVGRRIGQLARGRSSPPLEPLPLDGVRVTVCGVAEIRPGARGLRPGLVEQAWRELLGGADLIVAPTCPVAEVMEP